MGIENPLHLIFLAAIALIFLGPKRLPEVARAAGKGMREFRESLNGEGAEEEQPAGAAVAQPTTALAPQQVAPAPQAALAPQAAPPQQAAPQQQPPPQLAAGPPVAEPPQSPPG